MVSLFFFFFWRLSLISGLRRYQPDPPTVEFPTSFSSVFSAADTNGYCLDPSLHLRCSPDPLLHCLVPLVPPPDTRFPLSPAYLVTAPTHCCFFQLQLHSLFLFLFLLPLPFIYLLTYLFTYLRQRGRGREREMSTCHSTYLFIHWLLLVCALTRGQTHNLGISYDALPN